MVIPDTSRLALDEGKLHEKISANTSGAPTSKISQAKSIPIEKKHQSWNVKIIFEFPLDTSECEIKTNQHDSGALVLG